MKIRKFLWISVLHGRWATSNIYFYITIVPEKNWIYFFTYFLFDFNLLSRVCCFFIIIIIIIIIIIHPLREEKEFGCTYRCTLRSETIYGNRKSFKNLKKFFSFTLKGSFCSLDISIFANVNFWLYDVIN